MIMRHKNRIQCTDLATTKPLKVRLTQDLTKSSTSTKFTVQPYRPPQCAHVKGLLTSRVFGLLFYRDPDQALELVFAYLFPVVWYKNYCNTAP